MSRISSEKTNEVQENFEKLVSINKVAKVARGGRRFGFAALVVVGDGKGKVGFGKGKAREVPDAIKKATDQAQKSLVFVPLKEKRTLHHDAKGHFGAGKVVVRTAPAGTGIIAGGAMRSIFEVLGIQDIVCKSIGSTNSYNLVRATFDAFSNILSPKYTAAKRGKKISDLKRSIKSFS